MSIELVPLLLPIDQPMTLTVENMSPGERYIVHVRSRRRDGDVSECELCADEQGCLRVEGRYGVRGEHMLDVFPSPATDRLARLHFYVAPQDLYARRPLRGDFHIHSTYSDGRQPPGEMLIRGRELGLDVAVMTDHNAYHASIEGMAERERLGLNLITMPGEEVSGPNWHILSINADAAIYDLAMKEFGLDTPDKKERWQTTAAWEYETLLWAIGAVHKHGGRAYLAHPYWAVERGYHLPTDMYDRVLEEGILDGVELLGDVLYSNNVRSVARYLDFRAGGHDVPILGNSDTHGTRHVYGCYWTLIWTEDLTPAGVLDAIAGGWSVACTTVEPMPVWRRREAMHAFGSFELVDCAYFLEEQFYPRHDALCREEASWAYRAWRGETLPASKMETLKKDMETLYGRCFGSKRAFVARGSTPGCRVGTPLG
jgi:hypothetical protein